MARRIRGGSFDSDQDARVEDALRIEPFLDRGKRADPELADLARVPLDVIAADAVVMGDRSARGKDRVAGGRLRAAPLRNRVVELGAGDGEVQGRSRGVHMRDV